MSEKLFKLKLLKLYEFLYRETDEDHPVSRNELCCRLNEMGIECNVRTLSRDIRLIRDNGYEIMIMRKGREIFYYVADQDLSVPEIKILLDAVQAACFITEKKTAQLVDKIAAMSGSHKAEILKTNMILFNTRKHTNEKIFYTIDCIEHAIIHRKKITFHYFHLDEKAKRCYRTDAAGRKKLYCVEPVALIFHEDNYYLMAYSSRHPESTANYRIDRMDSVQLDSTGAISPEAAAKIEGVASYTGKVFKMFGGQEAVVELQFERSLIGPVFDKFGEQTLIYKVDDIFCRTSVSVQISPTFFGWLAQFGRRIRILSPEDVIDRYKEHIRSISESL